MQFKLWKLISLILLTAVLFALTGCLIEIEYLPTQTPAPTTTVLDLPSSKPTTSSTETPLPTATAIPSPTATPEPVTFTVKENTDMFSIALYYGITLDELKAANPEVNPNAMSLGTVLLIPVTPTAPSSQRTPASGLTPAAADGSVVIMGEPVCYPEPLGGVYCLVSVENNGEERVENPSVYFAISNQLQSFSREAIVFSPLNILPAGASLPVMAYFAGPVPADVSVLAEVENWLPVMPDDSRYAQAEVGESQIELAENQLSAQVSGEIIVKSIDKELHSLRLLAAAYDQAGNVVGLRLWEADSPINADAPIPFSTFVYSISQPIDKIELFTEARFQTP
jgi:LysM repeat protein